MKFTCTHTDGDARCGRMQFERGVVDTPAFMPVGTYATVKAMTPEEVRTSCCGRALRWSGCTVRCMIS